MTNTGFKGGPGKSYRKGISLIDAVKRFSNEADAEAWFVARRWPNGIRCPECNSDKVFKRNTKRVTPLYHCNTCTYDFTVKTGTIMHDSKLPLSKWAMAYYLFSTNLKGVSSMKLHRDLGITQKAAWHMAHRIRETWDKGTKRFIGPEVEADETYIGGIEDNKHSNKKLRQGRGTVGKATVAGVRERRTGKVRAEVVKDTKKATLLGFLRDNVAPGTKVYTDEHASYQSIPFPHESVKHSVQEYVNGMAHTNGIESFWALLKRGYHGTYHQMSVRHLHRYVNEFVGRYNDRPMDTEAQIAAMAEHSVGKRLPYRDLIGKPQIEKDTAVA